MTIAANRSRLTEEWRELASRSSAGIEVTLLWAAKTNTIAVRVEDEPAKNYFELVVESGGNALDVFLHPYAHAAKRGLNYGLVDARQAA